MEVEREKKKEKLKERGLAQKERQIRMLKQKSLQAK